MRKVTGIGGFYFRARDPQALAEWYETHFGILRVSDDEDDATWEQDAGPTLFAPLPLKSSYFGKPDRAWAITFRVSDLDSLVEDLEDAGIAVEVDEDFYPNGRFARLQDPEGNAIELWQPETPDE